MSVEAVHQAAAGVLQEALEFARGTDPAKLRMKRHPVGNKTMGTLRRALEHWADEAWAVPVRGTPRATVAAAAAVAIQPIIQIAQAVIAPLYDAANGLPIDIADWIAEEMVGRFCGKNGSKYRGILQYAGADFGMVLDHEREVRVHERAQIIRETRQAQRAARPPRDRGSPDAAGPAESHVPRLSASALAAAAKPAKTTTPKWKAIVGSRREQIFRMANLIVNLFTAGSDDRHSLNLDELFAKCVEDHIIVNPDGSVPVLDDARRRKLSRVVFSIVQRHAPAAGLRLAQLPDGSLVDVDTALASTRPASTTPSTVAAAAALEVVQTGEYDDIFALLMHLMSRNFHFKTAPATGLRPGISPGYPGHNICCIVLDPEGRIVGFDFNQCKTDQNLCSHAEKRLSEALNEVLKPTVAPGKPPSLEGYTFISSLEPCHMCSNFISRMGVRRIGFLMRDPMQMDAIFIAARMLHLEVHRPRDENLGGVLEGAFATSGVPDDDITSYLASEGFLNALEQQQVRYPLAPGSRAAAFFDRCGARYPGCVVLGGVAQLGDDAASDGMVVTTSDVLLGILGDAADESGDHEEGSDELI